VSLGLLLGGAGAASLLTAFATDRLAQTLLRPRVRPLERVPDPTGPRIREIEFPSTGEVTLRGWLLGESSAEGGMPPVILTHGWTGNSGELLSLGEELARTKTLVLVYDVRGHGRSDPAPAVTARHFRDDLLAAVEAVRRASGGRNPLLVGHSMGGAASVLAAVSGATVAGVLAMAAPADLLEVTAGYLTDRGLPGPLIVRLCLPSWRVRAGESLSRLNPQERVGELRVPLVVIHGSEDGRVPLEHARRLAELGGGRLRIVQGGGHSDLVRDPEVLGEILLLLETLRGDSQPPAANL
jgi:pimeloyl-ACP methyl ester carboxylesterase